MEDEDEQTQRHPHAWWDERYKWINEEGEPRKPDYKTCGRNILGLEYMRDEFPEQHPNEKTRLHCLQGKKTVCLHCCEIDEDGYEFSELARNLRSDQFLETQRKRFEDARIRAITAQAGRKGMKHMRTLRLDRKALRAKTKRKLTRKKKKEQMKEFLVEVRARAVEGYSTRQLMNSLIPDIGTEVKVAESEITAALKTTEAGIRGQGRGIINYFQVRRRVNGFYFPLPFLRDFIFHRLHLYFIVYISIGSYHFIAARAPNYFLFACSHN